jgi:hypothetical protein
MSISGAEVQVQNMRLHGYDLEHFSQHCESFQQLHRKGRGKLGLSALVLVVQIDAQHRGDVQQQAQRALLLTVLDCLYGGRASANGTRKVNAAHLSQI